MSMHVWIQTSACHQPSQGGLIAVSDPCERDWYFIAKRSAPAPHLAHPEGYAALRIVLVTALASISRMDSISTSYDPCDLYWRSLESGEVWSQSGKEGMVQGVGFGV